MYVEIENMGGISQGSAAVDDGINIVRASNWQGKSSFIHAIRAAFGTAKPLTEGESEGWVRVQYDDETYDVSFGRDGDAVVRHGSPVLEDDYDQTLVDLFAFLGERNEVRRVVRNDDPLADVLTRPLGLENLDRRIRELSTKQESIETELQRSERKADELGSLKRRRSEVRSDLETLREQRDRIEADSASAERAELSDLRAERKRVSDLIERLENTLERSREKLREAYEEHEAIDVEDPQDVEAKLADVRENYEQAKQDEELLQSIYSTNKRLLNQERLDLLEDVDHSLVSDSYACWLCGSETDEEEMADRLEEMGDKVLELREEVNTFENRIDELEEKRDEIRQRRRRKEDLEDTISDLEVTISEREESLESAHDRQETLEEQVDALSTEIEEATDEQSDVESEIKYKEAELEDIEEDIEAANRAVEQVETLEQQHDEVTEEIRSLRERKDEVRERIRTEFDEAIQEVVPLFETSFETARLTSQFELVVARDGREVRLDALSEGEVELLGLVVALAGFEAYDVAERMPIILLDQLGGLADGNLTTLAEYLVDRTDSLLLTAYPENSRFGDNQIDPTDWSVVAPPQASVP